MMDAFHRAAFAVNRHRTILAGGLGLSFWVLCALFAPLFVPYDPFGVSLDAMLQPPDAQHIFGTDSLGRDIFSRVMSGSRDVLLVSFPAAIIGTLAGSVLGLLMGYYRGWPDEVLSRIGEAIISLPGIILAILLIAALSRSDSALIAVIAFEFSWVVARTIKAAVLQEAERDYVMAAQLRGEKTYWIIFREIVPNIFPVIVVEFTVRLTFAVFTVSNLSFLGFGVQAPSPDWGLQVAESFGLLIAGYWWAALFPTLAIASLVIAIYLLADGLNKELWGGSLRE